MEENTFQKALIIIGDKKTKRVEVLNQELKRYSSDEILVIKTHRQLKSWVKIHQIRTSKKVVVIKNIKLFDPSIFYSLVPSYNNSHLKYIFVTKDLIDRTCHGGSFTRRFDLIEL